MLEHETSIEIAAPPHAVCEAAGTLDWLSGLVTVSRIDPDHGLGGSYRLQATAFGADHTVVVAVDAEHQPHRLGFGSVECREVTFTGEYRIEPIPGGARVEMHVRAEPHGRYRFLKPLISPVMHHSMADMLARLKSHVEGGLAKAA
jgi:hypothetical protein